MQSKCDRTCETYLYEYAVIRFVPSVEREEFINIGLIMMCKKARWLEVRFADNEARIDAFASTCDPASLRRQTRSFTLIGQGDHRGGPIAGLDAHERFRWLTAVRSACIQTSRPHPGKTSDLQATFDSMFRRLVL